MTTRILILAGLAVVAVVALAVLADAAARDWAIAAMGTILALLLRGGDHAISSNTEADDE